MSRSPSLRIAIALLIGAGFGYVAYLGFGGPGVDLDPGLTTPGRTDRGTAATTNGEQGSEDPARVIDGASGANDVGRAGVSDVLARATLVLVDAETRALLSGVRIYDQRSRRSVGVSDDDGVIDLDGFAPAFLVAWGDGYFATPLPVEVQDALKNTASAELAVWRDRYTMRRPLRVSSTAAASMPKRLALLLTSRSSEPESEAFPTAVIGEGRAISRDLRTAWQVHVNQVLGLPSLHVLYRIGSRALPWRGEFEGLVIRFSQAREYLLRARAADGRIAEARVSVRARIADEIVLDFGKSATLSVRVTDEDKKPLAGAVVRLRNETVREEVEMQDATEANGTVEFGGLFPSDRLQMQVEARGFRSKVQTVRIDGKSVTVVLARVQMQTHRVRVREYRSEKVLAGVRAWIGEPEAAGSLLTTTDASGAIDLRLAQNEVTAVMTLQADGYVEYREVLAAGPGLSLPGVVHLIPTSRSRQLELRLVAQVRGMLVRDGKPWPNVRVRLMPARDSSGNAFPDAMEDGLFSTIPSSQDAGRMILAGNRIEAEVEAIVGEDGRFVLWPTSGGRATVQVLERDGPSKAVFLTLGRTQELRVQ